MVLPLETLSLSRITGEGGRANEDGNSGIVDGSASSPVGNVLGKLAGGIARGVTTPEVIAFTIARCPVGTGLCACSTAIDGAGDLDTVLGPEDEERVFDNGTDVIGNCILGEVLR